MTTRFAVVLAIAAALAPAQQQKKAPPGSSLDQRTGASRVSWRVRTLVGDQRLLHWRTGPAAAAFPNATFLEAVARTDALGMNSIEASAAQKVSAEIARPLDANLGADEVKAVNDALRAAGVRVSAYRAGALAGPAAARGALEFAKALNADLVIATADAASLAALDLLANELGVSVALDARNDPKSATAGLDGVSKRIGIAIDTGAWAAARVQPADALPLVKDRLLAVTLRDRGATTAFFHELNRLAIRPLAFALHPAAGADLGKAVDAFETAIQPVLGAFVVAASKNMPIRGGDTLPDDVKAKIDAAIPRTAYAKPKKPRKLLVIDACVANMSHNTIPHFNLAIELMAKYTKAFEAVFSNDLENLRWPKIKEFDAIYLNDTVGELFPDLEIRQSLLRYVREGGGIGGWHGSPWASRSWRELGEMMGAMDAPHRIEPAYIKLDDPKSPINQAFDGTGLEHTEEYYRFHYEGPTAFYSRENLRVLLSLDMERSPAVNRPDRNGRPFFSRPDNDYAVAWIRGYGKGRVFYNSMGHMAQTMMSKQIMGHVFAAIQFLVGDLEADTTPSAKLARESK
jgi:type 1 glutamine amidotransferase/sugar phosphate isomerase/epimerase